VVGAIIECQSDSDTNMDSYWTSNIRDLSDTSVAVVPQDMYLFTNYLLHCIENNNELDKVV